MDAATFVKRIQQGNAEEQWATIVEQGKEKHLPEGFHTFLCSMEQLDRQQFFANLQASMLSHIPVLSLMVFSPMEFPKPVNDPLAEPRRSCYGY